MFANDRGWLRRMQDAVRTGLTAEAAVESVNNAMQCGVGVSVPASLLSVDSFRLYYNPCRSSWRRRRVC